MATYWKNANQILSDKASVISTQKMKGIKFVSYNAYFYYEANADQ
jgi:hypothetical protein